MPLWHCKKCHHEWEGNISIDCKCDWCKSQGYIINPTTPLEEMLAAIGRGEIFPNLLSEKE